MEHHKRRINTTLIISLLSSGTPGANTPQTHHRRQPTFATQRERLYHAGPGRYVAVEDVEPQQSDDIPLRRGMEVEGVCTCVYVYTHVCVYILLHVCIYNIHVDIVT